MNINSKIDSLFYMYDSFDTDMYIESFIDDNGSLKIFTEKAGMLSRIVEAIKTLCQKVVDTITGIVDKITSGFKGTVQVPKTTVEETNKLTTYAADLYKTVSGGTKGIAARAKEFIKKHPKATVAGVTAAGAAAFVILKPDQFKELNEKRKNAINQIKGAMHNIKVGAEVVSPEEYEKAMKGNGKNKGVVVDAAWREVSSENADLLRNVQDWVHGAQIETSNYKLLDAA